MNRSLLFPVWINDKSCHFLTQITRLAPFFKSHGKKRVNQAYFHHQVINSDHSHFGNIFKTKNLQFTYPCSQIHLT